MKTDYTLKTWEKKAANLPGGGMTEYEGRN